MLPMQWKTSRSLTTLFLLLLVTCLHLQGIAKCANSGLSIYPKPGEIYTHQYIILEGYGVSQSIIELLDQHYTVYLKSSKHKIDLQVKEINKGSFRLTQALLLPTSKLHIGETYQFHIEKHTYDSSIEKKFLNELFQSVQGRSWTVKAGTDQTAPVLKKEIQFVQHQFQMLGCGPLEYYSFDITAKDQSDIWIKIEVEDQLNQTTTYALPLPKDHLLRIGHGMCSGAFGFQKEQDYKVRFQLFDILGNSTQDWSKWFNLVDS